MSAHTTLAQRTLYGAQRSTVQYCTRSAKEYCTYVSRVKWHIVLYSELQVMARATRNSEMRSNQRNALVQCGTVEYSSVDSREEGQTDVRDDHADAAAGRGQQEVDVGRRGHWGQRDHIRTRPAALARTDPTHPYSSRTYYTSGTRAAYHKVLELTCMISLIESTPQMILIRCAINYSIYILYDEYCLKVLQYCILYTYVHTVCASQ